MKVTKTKWIYDLVDESGFTKKDCSAFVDAFVKVVYQILESGNEMQIRDFGIFGLKAKRQFKVPDSKTESESLIVPPHTVIRFKPSKKLKEAVFNVQPKQDNV